MDIGKKKKKKRCGQDADGNALKYPPPRPTRKTWVGFCAFSELPSPAFLSQLAFSPSGDASGERSSDGVE